VGGTNDGKGYRSVEIDNLTNLEEGKEQSDSFNIDSMLLQSISVKQKRKGSFRLQVIGSQEVKIIHHSFLQ